MQHFVAECQTALALGPLRGMLEQLIAHPLQHARFVNTLAHMEFVGVRKMLRARHTSQIDEDGLHHLLEEASHAWRLKRAASKLAGIERDQVRTFAPTDCLAGGAGDRYLQQVDAACEQVLRDLPIQSRSEANYALSSLIIEIRADAFYPLYEECLRAANAAFSVRGILRDEERHLAEMIERVEASLPQAESRVREALRLEERAYQEWLAAIDAAMRGWFPSEPRCETSA